MTLDGVKLDAALIKLGKFDAENEQTIRRNGKWVKITKSSQGKWLLAKGWEGSYQASKVLIYPTKNFALVAARNYLDD